MEKVNITMPEKQVSRLDFGFYNFHAFIRIYLSKDIEPLNVKPPHMSSASHKFWAILKIELKLIIG